MNRNVILAALAVAFLVLVGGCVWQYQSGREAESYTKQLFAMDTTMNFTAYGHNAEAAVEAAAVEVERLDALLSTGSADSEVSRINGEGSGTVSEDTKAILERALEIYEDTGGLFDVTIYPVMELWGFPTQEYHVPTQEELSETLALVDASRISLEGDLVTLGENQQMDFGGIAKGYTSNRVMEIYQEYGVTSGLVSLGGNVQALNVKPDGSQWNIGIRDPEGSAGSILAVLSVDNKAVVTSGGYERFFEENGTTYIHIIDPRTGDPADSDLLSVSVVCEDGTLADALSTSLYIMGMENAIQYWKEREEQFDMILVAEDGVIHVTEGISGEFQTEEEVRVIEAA